MQITRKGWYTITGPDGQLLTKLDGTLRRVTSRDECYERITEDGRGGKFTIHCPDREVEIEGDVGILIGTPTASSWQLAAGNYVSTSVTGMLPNIIAPRIDAERGTGSRYSWAYPGVRYEVPIVVQGGSYPFKFEITGTSGTATNLGTATIVETLTVSGDSQVRPNNYGVITWTPDSGDDTKTFGFTVQVTDQDGNTDSVTYTGTIQASQFIFYDSTDTGSTETGTITEPYNDWHSAFGTTEAATTNADKICYFRTGDHPLTGYSGSNNNYKMTGSKVKAYINYPDESPEVDLTTGFFNTDGTDDLFVAGINFHDNDTSDSTGRMFYCTGTCNRNTFWRNTFTDYFNGTSPGSINVGVIGYPSDNQYTSVISNTIDGTMGCFVFLFNHTDVVIEDNKSLATTNFNQSTSTAYGTIWSKDEGLRVSIRANDLFLGTYPSSDTFGSMGFRPQGSIQDIELCWNKIKQTVTAGRQGALICFRTDISPSTQDEIFIFRNSADGDILNDQSVNPDADGDLRGNILTGIQQGFSGANWNKTGNAESESSPFDSSGNLTGAARTSYLGTHGAEVA